MHDINLMMVTHARRGDDGFFTPASRALVQATARNCALLSALFWMSNDDSLKLLHEDAGMPKLAEAGMLSAKELKILMRSEMPKMHRHFAVLEWIMCRVARAFDEGGCC